MQSGDLRVFSTFVSVNGEVCQAHQGSLCTFIRLAGCNLRCTWCDTKYAQKEDTGFSISPHDLVLMVKELGPKNVTITGGEPMMQMKALAHLCVDLISEGHHISVETNGSYAFSHAPWVHYVVDFKLPSSGEYINMKVDTPWMKLRSTDWIKFVVADNPDYEVAKATIEMLKRKGCRAQFAMSPLHSELSGNRILQWLKFDRMFDVVLNLQLHKLVDLNEPD